MEKTKRELDIHADGYRQGYKAAIEKACKAFCKICAANDTCPDNHDCKVIEHVKKAMEE